MNLPDYDPEQEERTRRIREEIQRKIAERRAAAHQPQQSQTPPLPRLDPFRPVFQEEARPAPPPLRRSEAGSPPPLPSEPRAVREPVSAYDDSAAIERQRALTEQMEQMEAQRAAARRAAKQLAASGSGTVGAVTGARSLATELRDPRALRRAFVMREILDKPVALR